jgi:exosome complex component RRP41
VAIVPKTGDIVLLQMDGHLTDDEFDTAMGYAIEACKRIHDIQKQALLDRYADDAAQPREPTPVPEQGAF